MDRTIFPFVLLCILVSVTPIMGCFCDHYPWSSWSICTKTCNSGTQERARAVRHDEHWNQNNCQYCQTYESRVCNAEACPIHCQLTAYGQWSGCSPCAKKSFRTRAVLRPSQFGGEDCEQTLMEERPCHPSKECKIEPVNCKDMFTCDSGRCLNATLECNNQNDCGDNSDERNCGRIKKVCASDRRFDPIPGADLIGHGFDVMAEKMRGAVLDNTFMGGDCKTQKQKKYYRLPANIANYQIKVEYIEDVKENKVTTQKVPFAKESGKDNLLSTLSKDSSLGFLYILFPFLFQPASKEAAKASQQKDSEFFRMHQVVATSTFQMKSSDLYLSDPFLQFLNSLPLEYNYALYRQIFQEFGTHYLGSGTLGGKYDVIFQYDREELKTSGLSESEISSCISQDNTIIAIVYNRISHSTTCGSTTITKKHDGSMVKAAEKSFTSVQGGGPEFASKLAWEGKNAQLDGITYKDWIKSTIDNPAVIDYELLPLVDLVRGLPCAVTKRRHLRRALVEYLNEFDSCKCAPCPNNARPALSGTECICICQTGTYGKTCEKRAKDYTSEAIDGRWSCWSSWSTCDTSLKTYRLRSCNNPAPQHGGKPCQGPDKQENDCTISIFQEQNVCINDDEFETAGDKESKLPPGASGCPKPRPPANSRLRINKRQYDYGDHEEFICYTGFELDGFQLIYCLQDGTWQKPKGRCIRKVCPKPTLPDGMVIHPDKTEYKVGGTIMLECSESGKSPMGPQHYTCGDSLVWEPSIPQDLHCKTDVPFVPDSACKPGEMHNGMKCVCMSEENCRGYKVDFCVFDATKQTAIMMSLCAFQAGHCRGDRLYFMNNGPCKTDADSLDWAKFRARVSEQSSVKKPCGSDTCYEWETCSVSNTCVCKIPRDCAKDGKHIYCLKLLKTQSTRSMNLCSMSAMKCNKMEFEILNEGPCQSS